MRNGLTIAVPLPLWPVGFTAYTAACILDGLVKASLPRYAIDPVPPLYGGKIVYRMEPNHGKGIDEFASPWLVAERGWCDCDDAVWYRCLELRAKGIRATAGAEWIDGEGVHVWVRLPHDGFEDPSKRLMALERRLQR